MPQKAVNLKDVKDLLRKKVKEMGDLKRGLTGAALIDIRFRVKTFKLAQSIIDDMCMMKPQVMPPYKGPFARPVKRARR